MNENEDLFKWFIKILFSDGTEFCGIASSHYDKSDEAIAEIIGKNLHPFTLMTKNLNGVAIINPANVSAIYFYNNENYED